MGILSAFRFLHLRQQLAQLVLGAQPDLRAVVVTIQRLIALLRVSPQGFRLIADLVHFVNGRDLPRHCLALSSVASAWDSILFPHLSTSLMYESRS